MPKNSRLKTDNRKHPRFILILPITIKTGDLTVETTSKNISCAGVFCYVKQCIPINTEVEVGLKLSYLLDQKKVNRTIKCKGRIARAENHSEGDKIFCRVGIAFDGIDGEDREILMQYIKKKNLKEAKELKKLYLRLKEMAARLVEVEECHPTAEHFKKVINKAIIELDAAAHILDYEINELKNLE